jgi:hypothetical protein
MPLQVEGIAHDRSEGETIHVRLNGEATATTIDLCRRILMRDGFANIDFVEVGAKREG